MTTTEYRVTGMSCAHCEASIREEVGKIAGVQHIEVSAGDGRLVITADTPPTDNDVLTAVDEAGYDAVRV